MASKAVMKVPFGFKGVKHCIAVVLMCLDFRFRKQTLYFVREYLQMIAFDLAGLPGSSDKLNKESITAESCLSVPCDFHDVKKIVIVHHEDCTAYGGSERFGGDKEEEARFHERELKKARKKIAAKYPKKEVILVYARLVDNDENIEFVIVD
jgi:hypothetical protein